MTCIPPVLPDGRLLLVSPHLDDAVLSCSALLDRGEPLDVLTVFAGDPDPPRRGYWDVTTGFASSAESLPARRAEDAAAFAGSAHRIKTLSLLEHQYVQHTRPPQEAAVICDELRQWIGRAGGTIAIPAGAGRIPRRLRGRIPGGPWIHPDHVFVRDVAIRELHHDLDVTILLYEELPYRWGGRASGRVARTAKRLGLRIEPVTVEVDREAKAARIRAYASQIAHFEYRGRRLDEPEGLPRDECYWVMWPPPVRDYPSRSPRSVGAPRP